MINNIFAIDQLRGVANRKSKAYEFKTVRNGLVEEEAAKGWTVEKKNKSTTRISKAKSEDRLLEDRVWTLLYRMGFKYLSGQGGAFLLLRPDELKGPDNQIDVVSLDDEVAFAIECKSSRTPRRFADFSADLAKHIAHRERFIRGIKDQFDGAKKRAIVFAFWTLNIVVSDNDRARARQERVPLLQEKDLSYYEQLVTQIGSAARFQFLADLLEGRAIPGLELTVPAIKTKMGGFAAYTFSVSPEYLLKVAFVSHRSRGGPSDIDAYQRMLKRNRLVSLRRYITEGGVFPTNIVVNIAESRWLTFDRAKQESDGVDSTFGWLHIRPAYRVAWVIDGQHRLFAYANHPRAGKSVISVMAFVGLPASEQARMFVDINAEQRKVKQSLLQELYAELHWDAAEPAVRIQAILSKAVQALDTEISSPFKGRILKADDVRSEVRCISLTSIFRAMEKSGFFIGKMKKGEVVEYGPLWEVDNTLTLKRTVAVVSGYFDQIRSKAPVLWAHGAGDGGGLAMNDGVTVCLNVLKSIFQHLQANTRIPLTDLSNEELIEVLQPWGARVGEYFGNMTHDQVLQFRALRGVQGQTTGTRRLEEALHKIEGRFNPPGLQEFLEREKAQTTTRAFQEIQTIEHILQATVTEELKSEFGEAESEWWFGAVPKSVRKKVDDRINEEGGKKGGREQNFDLIDYREVIVQNWALFEPIFGRGKGSKDAKTKWIVEVNELRKPVMHASKGQSLPITEEQLALLQEIREWLQLRTGGVREPATDAVPVEEQ